MKDVMSEKIGERGGRYIKNNSRRQDNKILIESLRLGTGCVKR